LTSVSSELVHRTAGWYAPALFELRLDLLRSAAASSSLYPSYRDEVISVRNFCPLITHNNSLVFLFTWLVYFSILERFFPDFRVTNCFTFTDEALTPREVLRVDKCGYTRICGVLSVCLLWAAPDGLTPKMAPEIGGGRDSAWARVADSKELMIAGPDGEVFHF
jgi:hypothetical protein